ncbi:uncharacterized protein N7529_001354 [Penicillium soppii]|uniref:uncharacterized protein n=1 Tax=Penicillium soppii TaxID=69789 RepID=UPI002547D88D|nr:uncharacterized protein N7529_001354 [Penicillium soppii]KAJ5875770.1 hypothetical protein N7529_001354 [Penicillium soppii]
MSTPSPSPGSKRTRTESTPSCARVAAEHRRQMSMPVVHTETPCSACFRVSVANWFAAHESAGFPVPFAFYCKQDTDQSRKCVGCFESKGNCIQLPVGLIGHRFELLAVLAWLAEFCRIPGMVPEATSELALKVRNIMGAFFKLLEQHQANEIADYASWLANHQPEYRVPLGNPVKWHYLWERSRACPKLQYSEENVNFWMASLANFHNSVSAVMAALFDPTSAEIRRIEQHLGDFPVPLPLTF